MKTNINTKMGIRNVPTAPVWRPSGLLEFTFPTISNLHMGVAEDVGLALALYGSSLVCSPFPIFWFLQAS